MIGEVGFGCFYQPRLVLLISLSHFFLLPFLPKRQGEVAVKNLSILNTNGIVVDCVSLKLSSKEINLYIETYLVELSASFFLFFFLKRFKKIIFVRFFYYCFTGV